MQILRAIKIVRVAARYRLDLILKPRRWLLPVTLLAWINPRCWRVCHHYTRGERLRLALETLGPIFVKFGQVLSTRRDLLPNDISDELAKLQDSVPPFSDAQAYAILAQAYQKPANEIFIDLSATPLASASIAQVYTAKLALLSDIEAVSSGAEAVPSAAIATKVEQRQDPERPRATYQDVIVKIIRPNIKKIITQDIQLLFMIAKLVQRFWPETKRLRPKEVVGEIEKTIFHELDLLREAANASQLRRNFTDSPMIYVPKVYWDYCRENVLVIERIYGTPISDLKTLREKNIDLEKLAKYGVEIFMTQVFRDRFFHADMHPGNVFVDIKDPKNPKYCAVDFGIMGTLTLEDQYYLAENFLAFFKRDYFRIAELHIDSGWVGKDTRIDEFEAAIRAVAEPIFQKPLNEISFAQLLLRLFQTARQFNMEVQPQLILLQKTLLNIEGLGRQLYPQLDLWTTAKPYLENWLKERLSPKNLWRQIKENLPLWLEQLPQIPELIYDALKKLNQKN